MDELQKKVRPIYSELRGYFSVAPEEHVIFDNAAVKLADQLNETIGELNLVSGQNYNKFKINPSTEEWNRSHHTTIRSLEYKNKLSGLISKLQGEFFSEEQLSSSGPNTVINANQNQVQYQQQSVAVDIAMLVAEKRLEYAAGSPERSFLERFGESLKSVKGVQEIIQNIFSIATATGVGLEVLKKIFGI